MFYENDVNTGNKDFKRRSEIMNGLDTNKDYKHFEKMDLKTLRLLIKERFADPEDMQNDAPSIQEFADFLEKHPDFTVHGYTIGAERDDHRVSVEGLEFDGYYSKEDLADFIDFQRTADEFEVEPHTLRSWWD